MVNKSSKPDFLVIENVNMLGNEEKESTAMKWGGQDFWCKCKQYLFEPFEA